MNENIAFHYLKMKSEVFIETIPFDSSTTNTPEGKFVLSHSTLYSEYNIAYFVVVSVNCANIC